MGSWFWVSSWVFSCVSFVGSLWRGVSLCCGGGVGFISGNISYSHLGVASGICAWYFMIAMSLLVLKNATCAARSITFASFIRLAISSRSLNLNV